MVHDVLGIGFGPANLALAIALEEEAPQLTARFLEARTDPVWQGGMLLDGSNTQNHPSRDLVTLRNPRSRYSFLNYLFENDRLVEHLNLPVEFPLRKEYADYVRWAGGHFAHLVDYGAPVVDIARADGGPPRYRVSTADGRHAEGRCLVLATGRTPYVPPPFAALRSPRIVHLTDYLPRVRQLPGPPGEIAVVGGSQSAVELTLDLSKRFPGSRVTVYARSFSLRGKDHSPFSEEGYFPEFTDRYFRAGRAAKRDLDAYLRPTNYSASDADVLHELYLRIYEQRLDGDQRVFVRGHREIRTAGIRDGRVILGIEERSTGRCERAAADLVVLATGFRDLGPGPRQEPYPALLSGVVDRFRFDEDGYLAVNADYSVQPQHTGDAPLFLNGLCESTHGIGDAGSFSLLSLRAARILDGLRKSLPGATDVQTAL